MAMLYLKPTKREEKKIRWLIVKSCPTDLVMELGSMLWKQKKIKKSFGFCGNGEHQIESQPWFWSATLHFLDNRLTTKLTWRYHPRVEPSFAFRALCLHGRGGTAGSSLKYSLYPLTVQLFWFCQIVGVFSLKILSINCTLINISTSLYCLVP